MNVLENRESLIGRKIKYITPKKSGCKNVVGIYFCFLGNEITYVGKSSFIANRLRCHRYAFYAPKFDSYCYIEMDENIDLYDLERQYIQYLKPSFNKTMKTPKNKYTIQGNTTNLKNLPSTLNVT